MLLWPLKKNFWAYYQFGSYHRQWPVCPQQQCLPTDPNQVITSKKRKKLIHRITYYLFLFCDLGEDLSHSQRLDLLISAGVGENVDTLVSPHRKGSAKSLLGQLRANRYCYDLFNCTCVRVWSFCLVYIEWSSFSPQILFFSPSSVPPPPQQSHRKGSSTSWHWRVQPLLFI